MAKTVLSKPGSVGLSISGEKDRFKIIANIIMMGERLLGKKFKEDAISGALKGAGLEPTPENIDMVKTYFNPRDWGDEKLDEAAITTKPIVTVQL